MLYLSKLKTKIYLIVLCGLITLHVSFLSLKNYTAKLDNYKIYNATEEQYQSCLSSISHIRDKTEFINNTEINYLFNLSDKSKLFFYLGYFLIISLFIISVKFNFNESGNEK